jgi:RecA/RadA recombinase
VPDWRDEVCSALDFCIGVEGGAGQSERLVCIGPARQESRRGWYSVDLRDSSIGADQIESLRISGKDGPRAGPSHPVLEAAQVGPVVRVRVAEFVNLVDAYLWQNKQPPAYLLVKLREGIAQLADAGLAHDLAAGRLASAPKVVRPVAGFTDQQQEAYESCLSAGVRLVWGPPGTGKTRVLTEAIARLVATGRRVLLVSATNIAVDNALLGVIRSRPFRPGSLLRVGLPHHPDVLQYPDVCLPDLVRKQLADVDRQRQAIESRLLEMWQADEELARLREEITGFDAVQYRQALQLISAEAAIPGLAEAVAQASAALLARRRNADLLRNEMMTAHERVRRLDASRSAYAGIDRIESELTEAAAAADDLGVRALTARHVADQRADDLGAEEGRTRLARLRRPGRMRLLSDELATAVQRVDGLEKRAREARELLTRRRLSAQSQVRGLSATTVCSRADLVQADTDLAAAQQAAAQAEAVERKAEENLSSKQQALLAAEGSAKPDEAQRLLVEDAKRRQLPALVERAGKLRSEIAAAEPGRAQLQDEYAKVQERFERLRMDAEGEIIRQAQLIATTLARLRTSKALMDGPYDVVLVDEVGAATLPEILFAVSRAQRGAVLLGDFLQLGPVVRKEVTEARRADVQRWFGRDVFELCGIATPEEAEQSDGCTALDVQHRFGPEIMRLANAIAYEGMLKAGASVRGHADDDPEIVLIDVDGLGDIAEVRAPGPRNGGWWPAGALLGQVLADYHKSRGERTGIVTPYKAQVEATLEALRDQEAASTDVTEVGTVHRFQGREFPIVVFDLVEDSAGTRWMAQASSRGGKFGRDGLRLFTVAITRAQARLYIVGSRQRIDAAPQGTPLAHVAGMLRTRRARFVRATTLITPSSLAGPDLPPLGPFSGELAEVLAQHVRVMDIHDERSFYDVFAEHLDSARHSIWIWAPWTATRVRSLLPVLADAASRGVKITVFVRDPKDTLQGKQQLQKFLSDLRAIVASVVEINVMHQKIVVIDEETVLLGSLNTLSQSWTREVMLAMRGSHFARKLLEHEHAKEFAVPPRCAVCRGNQVDLRRGRSGDWYWRCYNSACPGTSANGRKAWTKPAAEKRTARAPS